MNFTAIIEQSIERNGMPIRENTIREDDKTPFMWKSKGRVPASITIKTT
jgi:hypothetical protein